MATHPCFECKQHVWSLWDHLFYEFFQFWYFCFLLELRSGMLVDATTFVNLVTASSGLVDSNVGTTQSSMSVSSDTIEDTEPPIMYTYWRMICNGLVVRAFGRIFIVKGFKQVWVLVPLYCGRDHHHHRFSEKFRWRKIRENRGRSTFTPLSSMQRQTSGYNGKHRWGIRWQFTCTPPSLTQWKTIGNNRRHRRWIRGWSICTQTSSMQWKLVDTMAETDGESEAIHLYTTIIDVVNILVDAMGDREGNQRVIHLCTTIIDAVKN